MKTLEELFMAEIKNLYAMEKQIEIGLENISSTENEKLAKRIAKYKERNKQDYETIQSLLQYLSINPGNTTDSVVNEILENLSQIYSGKYNEAIEAGLIASMIRLSSYKTANYKISRRMAKTLKVKKAPKQLKKIRKKSEKHQSKFEKLARKKIYKKAVA